MGAATENLALGGQMSKEISSFTGLRKLAARKPEDKEQVRRRVDALKDRRADWHRVDTKVPEADQAAILYKLAKSMRENKPVDMLGAMTEAFGEEAVAELGAGLDERRVQLLRRFAALLEQADAKELDGLERKVDTMEILSPNGRRQLTGLLDAMHSYR